MTINWRQVLTTTEITVVAAISGFLGTISQTSGGSFDAKHLAAAGVAALIALGYKLAGVLSSALNTSSGPAAAAPLVTSSTGSTSVASSTIASSSPASTGGAA